MVSTSLWMDTEILPEASALKGDVHCDVAVVGSGIAGLSTAYELSKRDQSVIVIDRKGIASGMTARTSAHLAPLCDDLMSEFRKLRGPEIAKLFYESQAAAVDRIEEIQASETIACDFRRLDGYLFQGHGMPADVLDEELEAVREVGAPVHRLVGVPLKGCENRHVLRYPRQATFHPLKYLAGVAAVCQTHGVRFFANSPVEEVAQGDGDVTLRTAQGQITAGNAVIATNASITDRYQLHSKVAPYRTYVLAFAIARGELPDALYWDTEDPYHYVRLQLGSDDHDVVLIGGEDHKSGEANDAEKRFAKLESWARELIPGLGRVTHRWSGQVLDTIDYAGFIGREPGSERIYLAMGDSGQGLTHGVMGAMLNTSLILGEHNPWSAVYAPGRTPLAAARNFLRENLTILQNLAEYVAPGEIASLEKIEPGEGAILRRGFEKIAAYRDKAGELHLHSASCTHIGCHLHWNSFETCWDCPCHGSIFAPNGQPINAPAVSALRPVKV
ncbi:MULTISPECIES: FAD-dependent oxidoreductase [Bradyrhizobium]|jgi:glycine/D-amino acid oxidase-like deaminating enzyme/nitrite reductase/ring-hydroxylating ferredoxin subunit|uniref:Oxidoreductase n=2 Tax=Bradyrhizobium diazoefficiens TaxID=1355477 RepID=A0A810D2Y3_9BRAD|nr:MULTISPECIES: FAD-dependent oxidoreductase [Bradyrhizobium]MBP1061946.1 glycine/D-amino acid oxidase-like deaminating enzyme/nitrite reductase/ring-hydroxylating ferredoxin subunit [Bradyrhizobium japonicum]APO52149.1 2Fe-2S ferredoxin [Bradyrhizobium diazoefficiens]AWO94449.2 FAD-dependent oxidoreductase [Bradyrhizobium diazoefficiens]KOY04923.1 2Fe-2S ferredoxin [Bradyrhizobium diazoefficiens]MCD9298199.1 FAD-dependent oxidoreductase [Bradyrhizobium diazoefficiens]